ncbi:MAG: DUF6602 domain-containing protein [Gemmataceae bacterium]
MATEIKASYANLFQGAFQEASAFLRTKLKFEKEANRNNFDSGIPLEDYFRAAFGRFVPQEYAIDCGSIVDRTYTTCGDCDVIIYSPWYAPLLKFPAAEDSRRKIFPNEATYGIIEVKQAFKEDSLKEACEKIHDYKSLDRKPVNKSAVVPGLLPPFHKRSEPYNLPFGVVFFYDCELDLARKRDQDQLLDLIWSIEGKRKPQHRINALYVLDRFAAQWVVECVAGGKKWHAIVRPEECEKSTLSLTLSKENTLYLMFADVWNMLLEMHLSPPDFHVEYGGEEHLQNFVSRVERFG